MSILLLMSSIANADVVGPGPTDCPAGSTPTANHNGPYCSPSTCDDGACPDGLSCESAGLCVLEEERECGGMVDPENPCTYTHIEATSTCDSQEDCTGDTTCVTVDRCVEPASACGCAAVPGVPALMVLLGLVPLALRRRS